MMQVERNKCLVLILLGGTKLLFRTLMMARTTKTTDGKTLSPLCA